MTRAGLLIALSDERDTQLALRLAAWRDGYQAALNDAVDESLLRIYPAPGHVSEIEKRRYPPDGRRAWIIPRPGEADRGEAACPACGRPMADGGEAA
jgi:hypothetical protein